MDERLLNDIKGKINSYLCYDVVIDHKIKDNDIIEIFELVKGSMEETVLYYLISMAYAYHNQVVDQNNDNGFFVIYGDFFGTLFHKAVIDFKAFELSDKIISAYKKMCIDAYKKYENKPAYRSLYELVESGL